MIAWLHWLPDQLRAAGLTVVEVEGWQSRTYRPPNRPVPDYQPTGVLYHHTGTPGTTGEFPTLHTCIHGRAAAPGVEPLPGPLYAVGIGRTGTVYMIAAGRSNHAGEGGPLGGITSGNRELVGVTLETSGTDPVPPAQVAAGRVVCAVILRGLGQPAARCWAHREWAPGRKHDVTLDMDQHRARVDALIHTLNHLEVHPMIIRPADYQWSLLDLPDLVDVIQTVYAAWAPLRGEDPAGEDGWARNVAIELAHGQDPRPTLNGMVQALAGGQ